MKLLLALPVIAVGFFIGAIKGAFEAVFGIEL